MGGVGSCAKLLDIFFHCYTHVIYISRVSWCDVRIINSYRYLSVRNYHVQLKS